MIAGKSKQLNPLLKLEVDFVLRDFYSFAFDSGVRLSLNNGNELNFKRNQ